MKIVKIMQFQYDRLLKHGLLNYSGYEYQVVSAEEWHEYVASVVASVGK